MTDPNQQSGYPRNPWGYLPQGGPWQELRQNASSITNAGAEMRVGDTERAEMVDELGKHFSEGRLDEEEFRERMDRAVAAKTRGDLSGLLSDLPMLGQPSGAPPVSRRSMRQRRGLRTVLLVCLAVALTASIASAIVVPHAPWLIVAVVAFLFLRRQDRHRHALSRSSHAESD